MNRGGDPRIATARCLLICDRNADAPVNAGCQRRSLRVNRWGDSVSVGTNLQQESGVMERCVCGRRAFRVKQLADSLSFVLNKVKLDFSKPGKPADYTFALFFSANSADHKEGNDRCCGQPG